MPSCESRRDLPPIGTPVSRASVCFSPDGSRLAFAGGRAIPVWNVGSERLERLLAGHIAEVEELAYTADGRSLVSVSSDGTIRVWDVSDAPGRTTLAGHQDSILSACYSPDGTVLATASSDQTIRIWQIGSTAPPTVLRFDSIVHSVAFSSKGVARRRIERRHDPALEGRNHGAAHRLSGSCGEHLFDRVQSRWRGAGFHQHRSDAGVLGCEHRSLRQNDGRREAAAFQPCVFSPDGELFATGGTATGQRRL